MGLFTSLISGAINVATTPIAIVADVVTLGGLTTDREELYTTTKARQLIKDAKDITESAVDGDLI